MKLFFTPKAIIEMIVGGCLILGVFGIFSGESFLIGIMFLLIGILGVAILNPRKTIAMFKNIKENNDINKEIKGMRKERELIINKTKSEVNELLSAKVISKDKVVSELNDKYSVSIRTAKDGQYYMLDGYDYYMKCCEGQEINVNILSRFDENNELLEQVITECKF